MLRKDDASLYDFSRNLRQSRSALLTGKGTIHYSLDDDRIAALDAIGCNWNLGVSIVASKDYSFFAQVDELKAYKEQHGHINVSSTEDLSLNDFCVNVRQSRKGKGTRRLDDRKIAALDAIRFDWNPGGCYSLGVGQAREEQRKASHVISHNLISTMPTPVLRPWDDENMTGSNNKKRRVRTIALTNETAGADGAIV